MTDRLPPNLLALFTARPPLRWVPPCDNPPEKRKTMAISGVADFVPKLDEYAKEIEYHPTESWLEARDRKEREKKEAAERLLVDGPKNYKPQEDPNIRGDAFKTLIVARLDYNADEKDLEREFGRFGPIERIRIIRDTHAHKKPNKKHKPHRGYAFVVYEREKDMRAALDNCDGIRIKERRIKVDVERGRTVKHWKPRRLGGGLGGRGYTKSMMSRPMGPSGGGFGGGFRGGFGGGFRGRDRGFRGGGGGGGFGGGGDRGFRGGGGGGGGFGGGRGGDRGFGGGDRGFGGGSGGPPNAPSGPGGSGGGYGGRDNRDGGRRDGGYGGSGGGGGGGGGGYGGRDGGSSRSYDDKSGGGGGGSGGGSGGGYRDRNPRQSGSNMEPVRPRGGDHGGYNSNRDYDRPRDDDSRKRGFEGSYEDPRKLRRY
ncbi:U1 small nuclear ribonucleoprotein of 70kDa MW N terminal-domain-containing protein [Podospora fimiseda]|uniref:U1 small nuclear ribonucleoprotein of 70kDa MW N terminal-domain-containing protein n=1 Tax=Podospora fimiseda TaxID=252190 RepID=A0AAN7H4U2_9PEZI|nr:U1 small nuclear ribonucleoprotein of 70kDa MW N terminal-domain-containing protein [Podospora fimiseda]